MIILRNIDPLYRVNKGRTFLEVQRFGIKQSQFIGKRQLSSDEIPMPGKCLKLNSSVIPIFLSRFQCDHFN